MMPINPNNNKSVPAIKVAVWTPNRLANIPDKRPPAEIIPNDIVKIPVTLPLRELGVKLCTVAMDMLR